MTEFLVVLTTVQSPEDAERLARLILDRNLAACVQILPPMKSIYRWQGKIEQADEILLIIKTGKGRYSVLEDEIRRNHPYETPEIIALPVESGLEEYLKWVGENLVLEEEN